MSRRLRRRGEGRRWGGRALLTVLVVCALVGQAAGAPAVSPTVESRPAAGPSAPPSSGVAATHPETTETHPETTATLTDENASGTVVANITLVTGHRVRAVERNGSIRYRTRPDADLRKVVTGDATYVYPTGVDFRRFDRSLFDVDLLRRQNLTDGESGTLPVIVSKSSEDPGPRSPPIRDIAGTTDAQPLASIDAVGTAVRKSEARTAFEELAANGRVRRVTLDVSYEVSLDEVTDATGVDEARATHGVSGEGVTVAVVDSGIDDDHPDLGGVVAERDFTGEDPDSTAPDPVGHGTHVAGIVAGDGTASGGQYVGVAPNASLLDARAVGSDGRASTSDVIRAINWSVEQGADVVSVSIGGPVERGRSGDPYRDAIDSAVDRGVTVVVSAGNEGPDSATVRSPGIARGAITVGAVDKNGQLAHFSSRGPTPVGFYVKPDIVAPGSNVVSAASADADYDSDYLSMSGTSMSTPAVSGIAALLLEERPALAPQQVKNRLLSTADPVSNRTVYEQGAGAANASRALDPNAVVSPGVTDFGAYAANRTVSKSVTVRNAADESRTVALGAQVSSLDGTQAAAPSVGLNRSTLALGPGETATVALEVQTGDSPGVYGGRISVSNATADSAANVTTTAIFGFARTHRLTISKHALGSGSASGDTATVIADSDSPYGDFQTLTLTDGTANVSAVNPDDYTVVSPGTDEETGRPVVTVARANATDSEVHLREDDAVAYRLNASLVPEAVEPLRTNANYRVSTPRFTYVGEVGTRAPSSPDALFSPSENLNVTVENVLGSRDSNGTGFDRANLYDVVSSESSLTAETTHTVRPEELGRLNLTYRRTGTETPYDLTLATDTGGPREVQFDHAYRGPLGERTAQTVHVSQSVERVGLSLRSNGTDAWAYGPATADRSVPAGGEAVSVVKNVHPLRTALGLDIDEGTDSLTATSSGQISGDDALADARPGRLVLAVNGTTRANETLRESADSTTVETALTRNASVLAEATDATDAFALSGATATRYRFDYRPETAYRPPNVSFESVRSQWTNGTNGTTRSEKLGVRNDVAPGAATVEVAVDRNRSAVESVTVAAFAAASNGDGDAPASPFDGEGGVRSSETEWESANVSLAESAADSTRYAGAFDLSAEGTVALAVRVETTAGSVTERVARPAFRVEGVAPLSAATGRPTDVDGDGTYEDTDGDGAVTASDAALLFEQYRTPKVRDPSEYYDINGDGKADVLDAQRLLANSTSRK